jgi:hypothetical protein
LDNNKQTSQNYSETNQTSKSNNYDLSDWVKSFDPRNLKESLFSFQNRNKLKEAALMIT